MANGMVDIGKLLVLIGAVMALLGGLLIILDRVPLIGRLPGDILVQKKNFTFYFPVATSIVLSILLTLIFWFVGRK